MSFLFFVFCSFAINSFSINMANERSVEEIMEGVSPTKSGAQYDTAWLGFMEFLGKGKGRKEI